MFSAFSDVVSVFSLLSPLPWMATLNRTNYLCLLLSLFIPDLLLANIHGLGPVGKKDDKKGAEKKEEEFNVGGARSNTAVLRPVRKGDAADLTDQVVKAARS